MTVVEDVVLTVNELKAAVVVCSKAGWHISRFIGINMKVYITYDYALVRKAACRIFTCGIAELVHNLRRENKRVSVSNLSD